MCTGTPLEDHEEQQPAYEQLWEGAATPPEDRYDVAYLIFYIQGIGQLFPWNAFITAGSYYASRFCGTRHSRDFENYFSVTFMAANLLSQAALLRYDTYVTARWSTRARMTVTLAVLAIIFLITTLLVTQPAAPPLLVFALTELSVGLCGVGTSFLQASMFGYAARFPPKYTQALMAGQGLAGLIVSIAAIATAAATPHCDPTQHEQLGHRERGEGSSEGSASASASASASVVSAYALPLSSNDASHAHQPTCTPYTQVDGSVLGYFACAVLVLLLCLLSFLLLQALPFASFYGCPLPSPSSLKDGHPHPHPPPSCATITLNERELLPSPSSSSSALLRRPKHPQPLTPSPPSSHHDERDWGHEWDTHTATALDTCPTIKEKEGEGEGEGEEEERGVLERGQSGHSLIDHSTHHALHSPAYVDNGNNVDIDDVVDQWALLWGLRSAGFAVVMVFLVTLAVFPSLTQHITSTQQGVEADQGCGSSGASGGGYVRAFVPLQFLLFNLFDWVGRSLPGLSPFDRVPPRLLPPLSLVRWVFVPLFLLCHVEASALPVWLSSDAWPLLLMALFACSNGVLSSLAMMHGPRCVEDKGRQREVAGSAMVLLLTLGLSLGSAASFLVSAISDGSLWHG